jgi:hypothetical protein
MGRSKRVLLLVAVMVGALQAGPVLAHDPRTTAKKLSHSLEIEGMGQLRLDYLGLHFNEENFERALSNEGYRDLLNRQVWGRMGHARLDFDVVASGSTLAPGDYDFGINMTPAEEFSVVFWQGESKKQIPLVVERDQRQVPYLTIAIMATAAPDTYTLEARCGPYRGTLELKVPGLGPDHTHAQ